MSPEHSVSDLASRIGKLEDERLGQRFAVLEQRVSNNEKLLASLAPLVTQIATLAVNVANLEDDIHRVEDKFDKRWDRLEESQESNRKDSRSLRNLIIGVMVAALLSPVVGYLFAAVVSKP